MRCGQLLSLCFVLFLIAPAGRAAEERALAPFLGEWTGVAITENVGESAGDSSDYTIRDLDVSIAETADGLDLTWTTHFRGNGSSKKKTTSVSLTETAPGVFKESGAADVLAGETAVWARVEERSLIVYRLEIDPQGVYDLSRYERRITPNGGMVLNFKRVRDGRTLRLVTGELVRAR